MLRSIKEPARKFVLAKKKALITYIFLKLPGSRLGCLLYIIIWMKATVSTSGIRIRSWNCGCSVMHSNSSMFGWPYSDERQHIHSSKVGISSHSLQLHHSSKLTGSSFTGVSVVIFCISSSVYYTLVGLTRWTSFSLVNKPTLWRHFSTSHGRFHRGGKFKFALFQTRFLALKNGNKFSLLNFYFHITYYFEICEFHMNMVFSFNTISKSPPMNSKPAI